jgi:hypothetical protein
MDLKKPSFGAEQFLAHRSASKTKGGHMPMFYFDIDDGTGRVHDDEGCEMKSKSEARSGAMEVLASVARDIDSESNNQALTASVRDHTDKIIFEAKLSLVGTWRE